MELRQLIYFEAVARHGGFSRAAEQLRIAQPAVSAQIKRLEAELGSPLFERTTRRVALTQAGELVLARTRSILGQVEGTRTDLDELAAVSRGHLSIGATQLLAGLDLPGSLARFHHHYPGVTLALCTGLIADLLADLEAGHIDVALAPVHPDLPGPFHGLPLAAESIVLATPPGRFPGTGPLPLRAVRDEPFICLRPGSGLHTILLAATAAAGFTPEIPFQTHSPASIRELVAAGLGVALLAGSAAHGPGPVIAARPLRPGVAHPPVGLIWSRHRPLSPAARAWQQQLASDGQASWPART
jgi:DNA-binding transcriptional LysR family regulator